MAAQSGRVDTVPPLHRDLGTRAGGAYAPWGFSPGHRLFSHVVGVPKFESTL